MKYDWHGYEAKLAAMEKSVRKSKISEKNKKIIFDFKDHLVTSGLSKPRVLKYMEIVKLSSLIINKDMDKVTKKDVMAFVSVIEQRDYSEWTKLTYRALFKRFFQWFKKYDRKEYPPEVKWINTNIRKDRLKLPSEGDLLTEKDIQKLLSKTTNLRDRAIVSCLWESGCRVGELATLRIRDVVFDNYGCIFNVTGKTGPRKIRVINASSYLANWLSTHPNQNNRDGFVWVKLKGRKKGTVMSYSNIREMLIDLFEKAEIKKRCNPHIFRHARATFLANHLTEFQMNHYFGWVQGSDMPSTYVHLSGKDTDKALLRMSGVAYEEEDDKSILQPQKCPRCNKMNSDDNKFCSRCGLVLDLKEAAKLEEEQKQVKTAREDTDSIMNKLMSDPETIAFFQKKLQQMKGQESQA